MRAGIGGRFAERRIGPPPVARTAAFARGPNRRPVTLGMRKPGPPLKRAFDLHSTLCCSFSVPIRYPLGSAHSAPVTETRRFQRFPDAGGGTRTPDTRIMIPLL